MNKTLNLILMLLVAALAVVEGVTIMQNGANARNVLFSLLFTAFVVRRLMIHSMMNW